MPAHLPRRAVVESLATTIEDGIASVRVIDDAAPEAATLAPDDVVIAVRSANVGWVDLLMLSGQYQHVPQPPYTPGLEFAGEIVARGWAVTTVAVGDAVIADGLHTGPRSLGQHRRWGGFASYAVAPASAVIPLPRGYDADAGACLLGGAETAYHALVQRARVQAGEVVLVLGASGSTGLAAVAMAKRLGAIVVAVGRKADKLAVASRAGADHLVVLTDDGRSLREHVEHQTAGRRADVIYDAVGGALSTEALRAAAFAARFVIVGWASTPTVARGGRDPNHLPTNLVLMKSIDVLGSPAAIAAHRDPALRAARLARILAWADAGELRPVIGAAFSLDDLPRALAAKWRGEQAGNVVVRP